MIIGSELYVIGRGFIPVLDVSPGDRVYTLNGRKVEIEKVESTSCYFISKQIDRIDAGMQNVSVTDDARFLYYSEVHGEKYISFKEIHSHTPNKEYVPDKYLPVLSWTAHAGCRNVDDATIEYLVRCITLDVSIDMTIFDSFTGEDSLVFIHLLEHWLSIAPGTGYFGRVNVKARAHLIKDKNLRDEVCRIAALAGFTSFCNDAFAVINYESMPVPGSRPKSQKYVRTYYRGNAVNIQAKNRPILGRSDRGKIFYLPCTTAML